VTVDGDLIGMSYDKEQKVIGWHKHPMTNGIVEACCVIPGENQDELWLIVQRTINSVVKRYIEVMADFDWGSDLAEDCFFVDCGLSYDGVATPTITGLAHLEGQTVKVLADGCVQADKTVVSGSITLDTPASKVHAGLYYLPQIETMELEGGAAEGTAQGKQKRIHSADVRFHRTIGAYIGTTAANMEAIIFRTAADGVGAALPLFSGKKTKSPVGGWKEDTTLIIEQRDPLPMTVLAVMPRYRTEDK
jgi:hypothetical protein